MMSDELDRILKAVRVPERSPGYWEAFPKRVTALMADSAPVRQTAWRTWVLGVATACVVVALGIGLRMKSVRPERTDYAKLYREISTLFPHQVRAIITDERGVRLLLADSPDVPASAPLLLSVCAAQYCRQVITFSGQRVPIGPVTADVLTDGSGNIIVVGERFVWNSAENGQAVNGYRIEAERLRITL